MVRPRFVTLVGLAALAAAAIAGADAVRPFEALMSRVATAAPGTYVVNGTALVPVPDSARIPVLLQADVLRGPDHPARVGIVIGAEVPQAVDVRLRVSTPAAAGRAAAVVADTGGAGAAGPLRLVREFNLAPGDYDLEAVVGDSRPGVGLLSVARSHLRVPDLLAGSLAVTPVVLGDAATASQPAGLPFTFGQTMLTPAVAPRFPQGGAVSVAFRVFNWSAVAGEKPDLTVEYLFYERGSKGLHFFNKIAPRQLNADSLGTAFDPSAGSLASGMMIPLAPFTIGDFQLVVRVADNRTKQTAEQQVAFTVTP